MCYSRLMIVSITLVTSLAILLSIIFFISQGSCPQGHFPCANNEMCIQQRYICDGHIDCPDGEDEDMLNCADLHGGFWALLDSLKNYTGPPNSTCVLEEVPNGCDCTDFTVVMCRKLSLKQIPSNISERATILVFEENNIELRSNDFRKFSLQMIYLANNKISVLPNTVFYDQGNLQKLFLFGNDLQEIPRGIFNGLHSLSWLFLYNNKIHTIYLEDLDLKNLTWLDLRNMDIVNISSEMFSELNKLDFVYFKRFRYCAFVSQAPKCIPLSDGSSSVSDLLASNFLRITLWLVSLFTLLTNGLVLWYRLTFPSYSSPLNCLITSLASSDFLMGLYLAVIGFQDLRFKGNYMTYARHWMSSWFCTAAGLTATLSSEVSILMLLLISAERYLLIAAPLNEQKSLKTSIAKLLVLTVWIFGLIISILPVLYWRGTVQFYGANGFCFPLHIDDPFLIGWQYSAGVFLGLNGFGLIGITFLYLGIFLSIHKTRRATTLNIRDSEFVFRFFIIVLANIFCWVPIITLKILALMEIEFSGELYGWLTVFVIPINSAINPILYTFSIPNQSGFIRTRSPR